MVARIRLKGLTKQFGSVLAVDNVNLEIEDGELLALLGPSGCGKTTTLLMLAGIYRPTKGEIYFDNVVINDVPPKDRNVGLVFQSYALYPHMTVYDNIAFPLRLRRVDKNEIDRRVRRSSPAGPDRRPICPPSLAAVRRAAAEGCPLPGLG